ncbi:NEP1-interacting protein-like 2 isoform X2 [Papaver somniferum]|uniref:NEP1-interacting protein-like 2 isoform X2 n=1 Tax=Papaver somniferum TaxID=3469 RepID=UPI000E70484C|nr:NEP1-interacting protein-like 2 isoform X2 [Papaver somniferum]
MSSSDNRFNSRNWSPGSSRMSNNNRMFQASLNGPAFPSGSSSHRRVILVPGEMAHTLNPRLRQFIQDFPPTMGAVNQWPMELPPQQVESSVTQEEQRQDRNKLKKMIYNPPTKRKWCLYYRDTGGGIFSSKEQDDDSIKGCVICIEDFVPNTEVLVTPCNHMFHEECIIPWVKSHGQCPICRSALSKPDRDNNLPMNNNTNSYRQSSSGVTPDDTSADDLISLLRNVEFQRMAFTLY